MRHYHVMIATPGCLPDSNYVHETLSEARDEAKLHALYARDEEGIKVIGNAAKVGKGGGIAYQVVTNEEHGCGYNIEIAPCSDEECLNHME